MALADRGAMPTFARHLLPVTAPRRRPNHRGVTREPQPDDVAIGLHVEPVSEPTSAPRALAVAALATVRTSRRPGELPEAWLAPAFGREVDLVRSHLRPIRRRAVLAASFGREAFHGGLGVRSDDLGPVTVAYSIRWLELGDGIDRPAFGAWLAEMAPLRGTGVR